MILYVNDCLIVVFTHFYIPAAILYLYQIFKEYIYIISSKSMNRALKTPPKGPHIELTASTWIKDSHGLYDYEAQEDSYRRETCYLKNTCKVYRDLIKHQTIFDFNGKMEGTDLPLVAEVWIDRAKTSPQFKLKCPTKRQDQLTEEGIAPKTPYLVVREFAKDQENAGYPLKPGNVIKLGRVQYMVIESKNEEETFTLRDTNHFGETNGIFSVQQNREKRLLQTSGKEEENNCKICIENKQLQCDPLISPCNCKGSCGLIHVDCLRTWINSKVKKEIKGIASSYNFTKFECEICKVPFPQIVRLPHEDVEMMGIAKPNKPYILLESLSNKFQSREERCLHLISTEENTPIKIGRGHECEIRISDISVSRKHAEIVLRQGEFYIVDTKAKFGTLVNLEQEYVFSGNKSISIQCGRTVFEFKARAEQLEQVETE